MSDAKPKLILGCHGLKHFGIELCAGTQSAIVDLHKIPPDNTRIYDFLDKHCKVFDHVVQDQNMINNIVNFLTTAQVIPQHMETAIRTYIQMHQNCGLYLYVDPGEIL